MVLPTADTPLYNHPLPEIEAWLESLGCKQDSQEVNCWYIEKPNWKAQIILEIEELVVNYIEADHKKTDIQRTFKYSLSREDVESAVFEGP
jgi:hypothetical protein